MADARGSRLRRRIASSDGFSLVEVLGVVLVLGILAVIAIGVAPSIVDTAKGGSGAAQVSSALRRAREMSISRRRNVQVQFEAPNRIVLSEVNVPGPGTTQIEKIPLEGGIEFVEFGLADTPDGFGNGTEIALGGLEPVMFTPEGMFVDAYGDPINATIQVGQRDNESTANALTIMGATALVREWRWDGRQWLDN
jgi:prepilin-type N-terminal cleavage/methylation domain-containing protein